MVRVHPVLTKDGISVLSTHDRKLTAICGSSSRRICHTQAVYSSEIFLKLAFVFLKKMIGFALKILIVMLSLLVAEN